MTIVTIFETPLFACRMSIRPLRTDVACGSSLDQCGVNFCTQKKPRQNCKYLM